MISALFSRTQRVLNPIGIVWIYSIAGFLSLLWSYYKTFSAPIINPDGICYLLSAEVMRQKGLMAAMQLCGQAKWPFYSFLIDQFAHTFSCSDLTAAYGLNTLFDLMIVLIFIAIIYQQTQSKRLCCFAAAAILLASPFNHMREYIIRDHGYWAFYLLSMYLLFYYFKKPQWWSALAWGMSLLAATLFRIEGALFLLALPFFVFSLSCLFSRRLYCFLQLHTVLFIVIGGLLGLYFFMTQEQLLPILGRLPELVHQLQHGIFILIERYQEAKSSLLQSVLPQESAGDVWVILLLLWVIWYIICMIHSLSFPYILLILYAGFSRKIHFSKEVFWAGCGYIMINIAVTFCFLGEYFFLSRRYLIALSLTLIVLVPFAIEGLYIQWKDKKRRVLSFVVFSIVGVSLLGEIFLSSMASANHSKDYLCQAGTWLATHVAKNATLYVNNLQVMYYSKHFNFLLFKIAQDNLDANILQHRNFRKYAYCVWQIDRRNALMLKVISQKMQLEPVKIFSNKRGDQVVIYQT